MKLKEIVNYIKTPFMLVDPREKADYKAVQTMVKIDNRYHVGHRIHGIHEDIIDFMPEMMEREIENISAIRYDPNTIMTAVKLIK